MSDADLGDANLYEADLSRAIGF
ncbi:MAG: pentapeptide repeat-containing protein [Chloroflexota bacterium]